MKLNHVNNTVFISVAVYTLKAGRMGKQAAPMARRPHQGWG
jgi:hypothetical protein